MYDPAVGRFGSIDNFASKYYSLNPFNYTANNPIRYVDINGDSIAIFDSQTGSFVEFQDDGKETWSAVTRTYDDDGEVVVDESGNPVNDNVFEFNDPEIDVRAIKNGVITRVEFVSDEKVERQMTASGVDQNSGLLYAYREGQAGGKMDYGIQGYGRGDLLKNTFYVRGATAYNIADFGNYLFGMGTSRLGIDLGISSMGAHFNNFVFGRRGNDKTPLYDFGPGTYGDPGYFDSPGDQRALRAGYFSHSASDKYTRVNQTAHDHDEFSHETY